MGTIPHIHLKAKAKVSMCPSGNGRTKQEGLWEIGGVRGRKEGSQWRGQGSGYYGD